MIIYKITNLINNKIYIGQTIGTLSNRKNGHLADSKRSRKNKAKSKISKAIYKYGIGNFKFEVIDNTDSLDELNYLEQEYIKQFQSNVEDIGYNLLSGGHQNGKHSEETKKKIRESCKKNPSKYWLGKHQTKESNKKRSKTLTGIRCPQRANFGTKNGNFGKKFPEEVRKRISDGCKGRIPWNKGLKGFLSGISKKRKVLKSN